jgi:outer membrane lipoprotein-sorting protein
MKIGVISITVRPAIAVALLLAALGSTPLGQTPAAPFDAHAILARMSERNATLKSYRARVHVDVHMYSFPFLSPKLDGTSYYKRPDFYEVVFDRMPSYARGFQHMFNDVGNPQRWEKEQNITVDGTTWLGTRSVIVLRMTKKIHSDILDHTLAFIDPTDYSLVQMEWYYTNGGKITMTQQYRMQGSYSVLSSQHATIAIPYVHAAADSTYGVYETNVPVTTGNATP